ncbi:MAG: diaminopimelate epimerase [Chitinispirillaceae bacterium]|nr:diaminopimelate epimerase [Chitinispirillaceae bacterium]
MNFVKMEGSGNDFVVTHEFPAETAGREKETAIALCDRHRGIGGDGLILILPSERADFRMRIFNSDGSEAEMCGNGIRCCVHYIDLLSLSSAKELAIETASGIIGTERNENGQVRVDMGPPRLRADQVPVVSSHDQVIMEPLSINGVTFKINAVSMGNPHVVIYADDLSDDLVLGFGPRIETHPDFPNKTNVEFVTVVSDTEISMRVWERGCGETKACGTGACAAAVAGIINRLHGKKVTVHLPGGDLLVEWSGETTDPVFMTGPARAVYTGSYPLQK